MGDGIENRLHRLRAPFSSSKFRAKLIGAGAENWLQFGSISARLSQLVARSQASNNTMPWHPPFLKSLIFIAFSYSTFYQTPSPSHVDHFQLLDDLCKRTWSVVCRTQ